MKRLGALGVLLGLVVLGILAAPRVAGYGPTVESPHVPASAPVRIEFNRPMDKVSVETRLTLQPDIPFTTLWEANTLVVRPLEPWSSGEQITVRLESGARSTRFLPILGSLEWSFRVGKPRLLYLWPSGAAAELFLLDLETDERRALTGTEAGVIDYSLHADGVSVVYAALRENGSSELRLLDLISGGDEMLLECDVTERCQTPVLSPDGGTLAYERHEWESSASGQRVPGPRQVWLLSLEGNGLPVRVPPVGQAANSPEWSPHGLLTLYNDSLDAVALLEPTDLQPLNLIPNGLGLLGSWSPDGEFLVLPEIVFPTEGEEREDRPEFFSHLYRVEADTLAVKDLSFGSVEDAAPSFSPDGAWIAFGRKYLDERWTPGRQLWLMRADGSQARRITDEPDFNHTSISWSPASDRLAFMRFNQGDASLPPEIWVTDLEGNEIQQLIEGGYLPQWIP